MPVTTTNLQYALKSLWPQSRVKNTVYKKHPFLAMVPKNEEFYGDSIYLAVRYGDPQGRAVTFSAAQTAAQGTYGNARGVRFNLTRAKDYQVVTLETEAILASKRDIGSLVKGLDVEMSSGMNNIGKSLATALMRGRSGNLGRIGAITATSITLANINDISSFEYGMTLVASLTAVSANLTTPATAVIVGVDRDLGVLTFGAGTFTGTNWLASGGGSFLSASGDNANGSGSGNKILGLADWLPPTAPAAAESYLGVDRSLDATRLAGLRIDISGNNPEEGLIIAMSKQDREGGTPSHIFVNHADYRNIMLSLGAKVELEYKSVGDLGFETVKVRGPSGIVNVVADQDCPQGTGYALDMDSWKLYSLEGCPQVLDMDGNRLSRESAADRFESRIVYFANLGCDAPGFNAVLTMPA